MNRNDSHRAISWNCTGPVNSLQESSLYQGFLSRGPCSCILFTDIISFIEDEKSWSVKHGKQDVFSLKDRRLGNTLFLSKYLKGKEISLI